MDPNPNPVPVPEEEPKKSSFYDFIDPKYHAIVKLLLAEPHGRAAIAGLMAVRMWSHISSVWIANGINYAAQEVLKRDLTDSEMDELEKNITDSLDEVGLSDNAESDLRNIQEAFKLMVTVYNKDAVSRKKRANDVLTAAAKKMPLPFLEKLLSNQGTVVFVKGDTAAVSEFMHMGVGFMLQQFVPVNILADSQDGNFTSGLRAYKEEHSVPFMNFVEKWMAAGQDQSFMKSLIGTLEIRGPIICRNVVNLAGSKTNTVSASCVHNMMSAGRAEGVSMLIGVPEGVEVAKVRKATYVTVEKKMEATDPNNPMLLNPIYYVDGQACVFQVEESVNGGNKPTSNGGPQESA